MEQIIIQTRSTLPAQTPAAPWGLSVALHAAALGLCFGWSGWSADSMSDIELRGGPITLQIPEVAFQQEAPPELETVRIAPEEPQSPSLEPSRGDSRNVSRLLPNTEPLPLEGQASSPTTGVTAAVIVSPAKRAEIITERLPHQKTGLEKRAVAGQTSVNQLSGVPDFVDVQLSNVPPIYPQQLLSAGVSGTVILEFTINAEGRVTDVFVLKSSGHPLFDAAAVNAARHWHGRPAYRHGVPVETIYTRDVQFTASFRR